MLVLVCHVKVRYSHPSSRIPLNRGGACPILITVHASGCIRILNIYVVVAGRGARRNACTRKREWFSRRLSRCHCRLIVVSAPAGIFLLMISNTLPLVLFLTSSTISFGGQIFFSTHNCDVDVNRKSVVASTRLPTSSRTRIGLATC